MTNKNKELANLLFPHVIKTVEDYLQMYPPRKGVALRLAPSPTGDVHIGSLGMAVVCRKIADQLGGIVFLRIEDTDQKREIKGATERLIEVVERFRIWFDEGFDGKHSYGKYGLYRQSDRKDIYHTFAKRMVEKGRAYPCFCTSNELDTMRENQQKNKQNTGYYGDFVKCSNISFKDIKKRIEDGGEWVLRFLPQEEGRVEWNDLVRGKSSLPATNNHPIILKSNGLPPYNLAHIVDDTLMRTSHVVRGEEWLPSTAEHIQIYKALFGKEMAWEYCHMPVISIEENGNKRKLSKRKDKTALVEYFLDIGYPPQAVKEYLLTLYNTDFEMWRIQNPKTDIKEFNFRFGKIGKNSPLFDIAKLNHISREVISRMTNAEIKHYVKEFFTGRKDKESKAILENFDRILAMLAIDRETEKPRKDIGKWIDIYDEYSYVIPSEATKNLGAIEPRLKGFELYKKDETKEQWLARVKEIGSLKEVMPIIRKFVTGRESSPDLYQIIKIVHMK